MNKFVSKNIFKLFSIWIFLFPFNNSHAQENNIEKISSEIQNVEKATINLMRDGDFAKGLDLVNSLLEKIDHNGSHAYMTENLNSIKESLIEFLKEKDSKSVLNLNSTFNSNHKIIQVANPGKHKGSIYRGIPRVFLGFTPTEIIIHQGVNYFEINFKPITYTIKLNLNGDILTVLDANYEMNCWEIDSVTLASLIKWKTALKRENIPFKNSKFPKINTPGYIPGHDPCSHRTIFGRYKFYRLNLTTEPDGADIFIDKEFFGTTPKTLVLKKRGNKFEIMVSKEGYLSRSLAHNFQKKTADINISLLKNNNEK